MTDQQMVATTAEQFLPGHMLTGEYRGEPRYKAISAGTHERMHKALSLAAQSGHGAIPCEVCGELSGSINGTVDTTEVTEMIQTMAEQADAAESESPFALPIQPHRRHLYPTLPRGWERMTYDTLTIDAQNRDIVSVVQAWSETPAGVLVLLGPTGVGKTHLLSAATHELQAAGYDCSVWEFDAWHDTLRGVFDSGREEIEAFSHRMLAAAILVWDDIRAESTSSAAREMVEKIIHRRTQEGKPILITTNASEEQWTSWSSRAYSRLRAKAYATWLPMMDRDRRLVA